MDQTPSQSNRIIPNSTVANASGHDHMHRRYVIGWALLIIIILIIIGVGAWSLYQHKRDADFQAYYSQQQMDEQKAFLQTVAGTPAAPAMTAAQQKAFMQSVAAADKASTPMSADQTAAFLKQAAARDLATQNAARAEYDKTH